MSKILKIKSLSALRNLTAAELEQQANIILYGHPYILEVATEREIFSRAIYIPSRTPIVYRAPNGKGYQISACGMCRRDCIGNLCRACYRLRAKMRYQEAMDGLEWIDSQIKGVTMPETEWWDDSDLPAAPKRLAFVEWNTNKMKY